MMEYIMNPDFKPSSFLEHVNESLKKQPEISSEFNRELKALPENRAIESIVLFKDKISNEVKRNIDSKDPEKRVDGVKALRSASIDNKENMLHYLKKKMNELIERDIHSKSIKHFPALNAIAISVNSKLAYELATREDVVAIIKNYDTHLIEPKRTNIKEIVDQEVNEKISWGLKRMSIEKMWDEGLDGKSIKIGHLDSGIHENHGELKGKVTEWAAFSPQGEELVGCPPYDSGSHGTHTAGIMVGGDLSGIKIGIAPEAKLVSGMVLHSNKGKMAQLIAGIEWAADQDVHVLNLSLGFDVYIEKFELITARLISAGIFPSFAIGNQYHGNTSSPGSCELCCSVGAIDYDGKVPEFSSGATLSHYDPISGSLNHVVKPDIVAPGVAVLSCVPPYTGGLTINNNDYDYYDGTSMATPFISGIVALLIGEFGSSKTVHDIMRALYKNTKSRPSGQKDNRWGFGLVDAVETLKDLRNP